MNHARRCVLTPHAPSGTGNIVHNVPLATMPCPRVSPRPWGGGCCPSDAPYRPVVSTSSGKSSPLSAVIEAIDTGVEPVRDDLRDAVRLLLTTLRTSAPGRTVEVRVPPYGAIQCVAGPRHTRGTPPNVVETDPVGFVLLATGRLGWADAIRTGRVSASGVCADLSPYLPLTIE